MSLNTLPGTELSAFDNGSSSGLRDAFRNQIALPGSMLLMILGMFADSNHPIPHHPAEKHNDIKHDEL